MESGCRHTSRKMPTAVQTRAKPSARSGPGPKRTLYRWLWQLDPRLGARSIGELSPELANLAILPEEIYLQDS